MRRAGAAPPRLRRKAFCRSAAPGCPAPAGLSRMKNRSVLFPILAMSSRIIFLDTETTGLSPACGDRVIDIAALEVDRNFSPVRVFHEYLDPGRSVGRSVKVHGLTDEFLRGRRTFRDIADDFAAFVRGATVYAHNMPFDRRFINAELSRCGRPPLESLAEPVDTLAWARAKVAGRAGLDRLLSLCEIDPGSRLERHGALVDAELLLQVFLCLQGNRSRALEIDFREVNKADALYQEQCSARCRLSSP